MFCNKKKSRNTPRTSIKKDIPRQGLSTNQPAFDFWSWKYCQNFYISLSLYIINTLQSVIQFLVWQTPNDAPLSKALNIHGHTSPGVFHLFASDQGLASINGVRWSCRGEAERSQAPIGQGWEYLAVIGQWGAQAPWSDIAWFLWCYYQLLTLSSALYTTLTLTPWPFDWPIVRILGYRELANADTGRSPTHQSGYSILNPQPITS